jgi:type II secretory ATPase GspE/PulE/Tfp pilus assembly ATPase PilB-like protein
VTQATALERTEDNFPGLADLAPRAKAEQVQARLWDGSLFEGELAGFFADQHRLELRLRDSGGDELIRFGDLQWLKFTRPVDFTRNAEAFRRHGLKVEALPAHSPYCITFTNGHVVAGDLSGYGADLGGLGLYVVEEDDKVFRLFVPVDGIESFAVGERLGKLLLERGQLTGDGLELALERQRALRKQRLGGLLLEHRLISRAQLEQAIAEQAQRPVRPLGELLVEMGMLTREQVAGALAAQRKNRRKPIGALLVEMELIDKDTLQTVLAQKVGIPQVDLRKYTFDPNWMDLAQYPVCHQHHMVPLYRDEGSVTVALDDPLDVEKLNAIGFALGARIVPVLASAADVDWALERHPERRLYEALEDAGYPEGVPPAAAELEGDDAQVLAQQLAGEITASAESPQEQHLNASDSTLVRLVNKIIADAYHRKASDIHFEPGDGRGRLRVRFRRDGALFDYLTLAARFRAAIVSRIKIMANLDISEHRQAQDGKIDFKRFGGLPLELRVACIPTQHGLEAIVLRLLEAVKPIPLGKIGLPPQALERLRTLAERPYGLVLVCGPTGSGKTTTLHSVLAHLNNADAKIWTAEDPVEITQPGLTQVQMQPQIGWTFATALRAFLRADPDVIMVGEIRDAETARTVVEASLTGHLVLSTLHTNSAPESITRLIDIGIDPFNFTDALLGVLAQRLTRRLCPRCRKFEAAGAETVRALAEEYCAGTSLRPDEQIAAWRSAYAVDGELRIAKPVGCKVCSGIGFAGRLAIFELLVASPAVKRLMLGRGTVAQVAAQGLAEGMRTLKQDGIEKVLQGLTTIEQVRSVSN